jgi:hypothetical protein
MYVYLLSITTNQARERGRGEEDGERYYISGRTGKNRFPGSARSSFRYGYIWKRVKKVKKIQGLEVDFAASRRKKLRRVFTPYDCKFVKMSALTWLSQEFRIIKITFDFSLHFLSYLKGRAIAQVISHRLPTAAARVKSCGICGGQSGTRAGVLLVLGFPLPIFIPPIAPQSPSSIIWVRYTRPVVAEVPSGLSLTPLIVI